MPASERRKRSRWWSNIQCLCALVLAVAVTPCLSLEDNALNEQNEVLYYYTADVNVIFLDPVTNQLINETFQGKFGVESLLKTRTGLVVHVHDKNRTSYGCVEYTNKIPQVPWIALVERGGCTFTDKIKMATQTYNASAVVVYNNNKEEGITIMKLEHKVKTEVSISVLHEIGKKIAKMVDADMQVEMTITPGERVDMTQKNGSPNSISKTSVLFVSISFIVLMIISLAWLVFYYIQRFRYAHAKERLARRLTSAAKKAISKIPQKTVRNGDKELDSDFDQCAVCIEGYKPHDVIRTLPCKHVFHKSCVDPWLLDQRSCPMCKLNILRAFDMQILGSQESVHHDAEAGHPSPTTATAPEDEGEEGESNHGAAGGEDPTMPDTEVKVLLLPHTCLHIHSQYDPASPAGTSAQPEGHASAQPSVAASAERLTLVSSWQDSEIQALVAGWRDDDDDNDEEEEEEEREAGRRLFAEREEESRGEHVSRVST